MLVEDTSAESVQTMCGTSELQRTECKYIHHYWAIMAPQDTNTEQKNIIQWAKHYTTTSIVRFSEAGTAFDVVGKGVTSTGVAGASVPTLVTAGWGCSVLAMLDGVVPVVGGLSALVVGGDNGQIYPHNCAG